MEDCKKNERETYCEGIYDRCVKISYDYKFEGSEVKYFEKGCYTKALCDDIEKLQKCKDVGGLTCEFNCCDSDGCNGSAMPVISAFLLVICTLLSEMCF